MGVSEDWVASRGHYRNCSWFPVTWVNKSMSLLLFCVCLCVFARVLHVLQIACSLADWVTVKRCLPSERLISVGWGERLWCKRVKQTQRVMIKLTLSQWSAICDLEHSSRHRGSWGMSPLSALVVAFLLFSSLQTFPSVCFWSGRQPAWRPRRRINARWQLRQILAIHRSRLLHITKDSFVLEASKHLKCARSPSGSELVIVGVLSGTAGCISKVLLCFSLTWPLLAGGAFSVSLLSIQL